MSPFWQPDFISFFVYSKCIYTCLRKLQVKRYLCLRNGNRSFLSLLFFFFWLSNDLLLKYFPLYFLSSWTFHHTTVDAIYDVMRVSAINIAAHRLGFSLMFQRPLWLQRLVLHLSGNVHNLIKSAISTAPHDFSFSLSLHGFLRAWMIGQRQTVPLSQDLSVLNGQVHYNPQTLRHLLPWDVITNLF